MASCHCHSGSHTVMTSWWQRKESFLSLNVAGWLSCTSKRVQHAIAAEVGRSKTVILNFLKDPESYGPKIQVLDPKKSSPALSRKIRRAVREDTGRSSTQIKALTDKKKFTWTVLMAYNITGMTRRSHWRCFLPGTVEKAPSWSGVLFPSMG